MQMSVSVVVGDAGYSPHIIICHPHKSKVNVDSDLANAAFGKERAAVAWKEYHKFIDMAKAYSVGNNSNVLYIDLHGQTATEYNFVGVNLFTKGLSIIEKATLPDRLAQYSSIMQLHLDSGIPMEELVRGNTSIGGLMEPDFPMFPAPGRKLLEELSYPYHFSSYSLRRHTGWRVNGMKVSVANSIRANTVLMTQFADKLAEAVKFWVDNYL
ncbi:hypothetical protein EB796_011067 [Bugula neritina]|uniref:Uncharacterized protein n=1 Tax=Bugula neritina TaxID=10212 RepID=A0A7J7JW67_BUGNE|nr:hypothetical protein EB796_011067 [Bugula neritina]